MTDNHPFISENISRIVSDIHRIAATCGRDRRSVRLITVSKTMDSERVLVAIKSGATILGENYIQEAREKIDTLKDYPVSWHFIGHLQSNKAKYAVKLFDMIHSVDSVKLAKALNKEAGKTDKVQNILIQVNLSGESTKSGLTENDVIPMINQISKLDNVAVKGLMTMPPFFSDSEKARPYFKSLYDLARHIDSQNIPSVCMEELSMGMTGDYQPAIEEGATLVRIGTAIFGKRK